MNNAMSFYELKSIIDFKNGKIAPKSSGNIPIYGGNGILGLTNQYNYEHLIIIGRVGAYCGSVHIEKEKCWVSDNAIAGISKDNEQNEYNYYLLKLLNLNNKNIGSSQPLLTQGILNSIKIKIHDEKKVRLKIGNILSSLDKKIELNNKINKELESMAKTLYDYWFVQFDFPDENGKPYKSSGGKMVYNKELKREIPEGWEVENIFKLMDVQYGFPFDTSKFTDEVSQKPIVRIRDILQNTISTYSSEEIDNKFMLNKNDLLIGMDGNFHINFWNEKGAYLNQRSVRIRTKEDSEISNFQVYFEITPYIKAREKNVSRTTVGHLSDKDLKSLFLLVPNIKLNHKSIFDSILNKLTTNKVQNQELANLRDWLLPMLMNGQVSVNLKD